MGKIKMFAREVCSLQNDVFHKLLGTITLDVEPVKREVEKVIDANCIEDSTLHYVRVNQRIPLNAYNVKVTYTVKE